MKNITLLIALFFTTYSFSQTIDSIQVTYPAIKPVVVKVGDLTAEQIYTRAKDFINKTFEDPDAVIKVDDANKSIRYNGVNSYVFKGTIKQRFGYKYTMLLEFKPGKYRIRFSNIYLLNATLTTNLVQYPFKKDGSPRKNKDYIAAKIGLEKDLNNIHFLIYNYIVLHDQINDW